MGYTYEFIALDETLQMTTHETAAEKTFQRTQIRTGNVLLWMGSGTAQGLECLVG